MLLVCFETILIRFIFSRLIYLRRRQSLWLAKFHWYQALFCWQHKSYRYIVWLLPPNNSWNPSINFHPLTSLEIFEVRNRMLLMCRLKHTREPKIKYIIPILFLEFMNHIHLRLHSNIGFEIQLCLLGTHEQGLVLGELC